MGAFSDVLINPYNQEDTANLSLGVVVLTSVLDSPCAMLSWAEHVFPIVLPHSRWVSTSALHTVTLLPVD